MTPEQYTAEGRQLLRDIERSVRRILNIFQLAALLAGIWAMAQLLGINGLC